MTQWHASRRIILGNNTSHRIFIKEVSSSPQPNSVIRSITILLHSSSASKFLKQSSSSKSFVQRPRELGFFFTIQFIVNNQHEMRWDSFIHCTCNILDSTNLFSSKRLNFPKKRNFHSANWQVKLISLGPLDVSHPEPL